MAKLNIKDVDLKDKKTIIRVDYNVPLDKELNITDDVRIQASLPTVKYALEQGVKKLILMSHLGRPKGEVKEEFRLTPAAKRLQELIGEPVLKLNDCIGPEVESKINSSSERVVMLENLRFHPEEKKNDDNFAKSLASLADIYINDAFGSAHRAHASTAGITKHLQAVSGFLLDKEINYLGKALEKPEKPFVVILGGAKVSDKIGVIENLLPKADSIIIGGGMAYTFLKALGQSIGKSLLEEDKIDTAKDIFTKAKESNTNILLPIDHVVTDNLDPVGEIRNVKDIPDGFLAVDIGSETISAYETALKNAKTIIWNGPVGIFEIDQFALGTKLIAEFIAGLDAISIIGGGDTAAAVKKFNVDDKMKHVSTGGGASLEYMEGKELPGIAALTDRS